MGEPHGGRIATVGEEKWSPGFGLWGEALPALRRVEWWSNGKKVYELQGEKMQEKMNGEEEIPWELVNKGALETRFYGCRGQGEAEWYVVQRGGEPWRFDRWSKDTEKLFRTMRKIYNRKDKGSL